VPALSRTAIVACSGSVDEATARQAGFDGWLVKTISSGELDTVLAMVLQRINQSASHSETEAARGVPE
jgi:DNA-binding response OmpR family regulator